MNPAKEIKEMRKVAGLTQTEVSKRAVVGLRFVRGLEQGKPTLRLAQDREHSREILS